MRHFQQWKHAIQTFEFKLLQMCYTIKQLQQNTNNKYIHLLQLRNRNSLIMSNKKQLNQRVKSVGLLHIKKTIAQQNLVSMRQSSQIYYTNKPLRIKLPEYFNIPKFIDKKLQFFSTQNQNHHLSLKLKSEKGLKQKLRDLTLLAQGMKRAKNIREESRYYFIQGVLLHNAEMFNKSLEMFQKFLKIVLFIKDDKSIQLALNSIGIEFMYMNLPQNAKQYHKKQTLINQNSQTFIGTVNLGLCNEIQNNPSEAYECYISLQSKNNIFLLHQKKQNLVKKLVQRAQSSQFTSNFLTENNGVNKQNEIHKQKQKEQYKVIQSSKFQNEQPKQSSNIFKIMMKKSSSKKEYESAKIKYAISSAQQNISDFMMQLKQSLKEDSFYQK